MSAGAFKIVRVRVRVRDGRMRELTDLGGSDFQLMKAGRYEGRTV